MRAVVEYHPEGSKLPPLNVVMCKGREDVTIKVLNACFNGWALVASFVIGWFKCNELSDWQISDRGGGITRSTLNLLFNYMYSTAPRPPSPDAASMTPLVSCLYQGFWFANEHVSTYSIGRFVILKICRPAMATVYHCLVCMLNT